MSQKLPNMLESTIQKIREMVDVNSVVGEPIHTPDGVTIIPVSKVSVGFGGGGSDFATSKGGENPFGGGVGLRLLEGLRPPGGTGKQRPRQLPDGTDGQRLHPDGPRL